MVPFGSNWGIFVFSSKIQNPIQGGILKGVIHFQDFLRFWYISMTQQQVL